MPEAPYDWAQLRNVPVVTPEVYQQMPEEVSRTVEVVDGMIVHCESRTGTHQAIQHNLVAALLRAADKADQEGQACHRVRGDLDMLISEVPRFHYRRPDVVVHRCLPKDRPGSWIDKPYAADVVIAVETVSRYSVTADLSDKHTEYARAGIPHYWVVRMSGDNGPVASIERFVLAHDGYVSAGVSVRGRSAFALDSIDPSEIQITWQELDLGI